MTKKLNEDVIQNELRSGSVFFRPPPTKAQEKTDEAALTPPAKSDIPDGAIESEQDTSKATNRDTTPPRYHENKIEHIRKAVRQIGKEAATYRFTREEKKALADIVYTTRNKEIRTSENEIARIAINFIIQEYRENKQQSVLARVLERLNE